MGNASKLEFTSFKHFMNIDSFLLEAKFNTVSKNDI